MVPGKITLKSLDTKTHADIKLKEFLKYDAFRVRAWNQEMFQILMIDSKWRFRIGKLFEMKRMIFFSLSVDWLCAMHSGTL